MVGEGSHFHGLHLRLSKIEEDGLLDPRMGSPFAIGLFRYTKSALVQCVDDFQYRISPLVTGVVVGIGKSLFNLFLKGIHRILLSLPNF